LTRKNKKLITKQNQIKQKLQDRRVNLAKSKLSKAKYKLGKAAVGVIPFIGTGAIVALTYEEIKAYCDDINEFKQFEKSIFEDTKDSKLDEEKIICGYDIELIQKELSNF